MLMKHNEHVMRLSPPHLIPAVHKILPTMLALSLFYRRAYKDTERLTHQRSHSISEQDPTGRCSVSHPGEPQAPLHPRLSQTVLSLHKHALSPHGAHQVTENTVPNLTELGRDKWRLQGQENFKKAQHVAGVTVIHPDQRG